MIQIFDKIPSGKSPDKGNITVLFLFFLSSGLSAPSATNPFQNAPSKLTLNQLSSTVSASQPSSLPYSASLPLPVGNQPASLPSSLTHPTQPGLGLLGTLPEPLLPLSSASTDESQAVQNNQNPFLWGLMELENNLKVRWECSWDITLAARLQVQGPPTHSCCIFLYNTATLRLMRAGSACHHINLSCSPFKENRNRVWNL